MALIYYSLGKESGDESLIEKSNKMLEDEIMRYAGYVKFYQSLDASQYERLTSIDKFIDQQYITYMLRDYVDQCGEQKYNQLMNKLESAGLNMQRLQSFQQSYDQALLRQQQAAQQAAQAAQTEDASASLEEVLGN